MTKKETIAKAYGEHWEKVKDFVDKDGWMFTNGIKFYFNFRYQERGFLTTHRIRPKSLKGIETNNGWIKIESEADLPKDEDAIYWAFKDSKIIVIELKSPINFENLYKDFLNDKITHYQPIIKPHPPIY